MIATGITFWTVRKDGLVLSHVLLGGKAILGNRDLRVSPWNGKAVRLQRIVDGREGCWVVEATAFPSAVYLDRAVGLEVHAQPKKGQL